MQNTAKNKVRSNSPDTAQFGKYIDSIMQNSGDKSVPLEPWELPPFLQEYIDLVAKHTDAVPGAMITAFLPYVAVNIGNRVQLFSNGKRHFCRIWSVLVGPSSISRKSTCLSLAARTMYPLQERIQNMEKAEREKHELVIHSTTNAKMIGLLAVNSNRLFEFHEFGSLLKSATHSYNAGLKENLTSFYDGDSKTICNMDRTERVINPAVSIVGASTKGWITDGFQTAADRGSGFLQRHIYCVIGRDNKQFCSDPNPHIPDFGGFEAYDPIFELFRALPKTFTLRMDFALCEKWLLRHDQVLNGILDMKDEDLLEYATRIYNNVFCSLAIMFTMMKCHPALKAALERNAPEDFFRDNSVCEETVDQALYLCDYYLANARPMINIITEGGSWEIERKIVSHLTKQKGFKDSHSNIMQTFHIKARDMRDATQNLSELNIIDSYGIKNECSSKIKKMYRLLLREE